VTVGTGTGGGEWGGEADGYDTMDASAAHLIVPMAFWAAGHSGPATITRPGKGPGRDRNGPSNSEYTERDCLIKHRQVPGTGAMHPEGFWAQRQVGLWGYRPHREREP